MIAKRPIAACLGASVAALVAAPLAAAPVGETISVRNKVTLAALTQQPRRAAIGTPVATGDLLTTGIDAAVAVRLIDDTHISLGPTAAVRIDDFVFDANRSASRMALTFLKGVFRFASGAPTHAFPGQLALSTPSANIGIRGTIVTGVVGPAAFPLYRSAFAAAQRGDTDSQTASLIVLVDAGTAETGTTDSGIDVSAGGTVARLRQSNQAVFIRRSGAPPSEPFLFDATLLAGLEERVDAGRRNGNRDGNGPGQPSDHNGGNPPSNQAPPQSPQQPAQQQLMPQPAPPH